MTWTEQLHSGNWEHIAPLCFCAYALGCLTSGYYLVRWCAGKDVRECGSGSVGARNVGRLLGKPGFLLTLLLDFGKGLLIVSVARHFGFGAHEVAMAGVAMVAGHIWPVQLRFHGGKGMASSLGFLLAFDPKLAFTFALLFLCFFACLRKSILPGMLALLCVPLAAKLFDHSHVEIIDLSVLVAFVLFAHRKNIVEEISQLIPRRHDHPKPDHL